MKRLAIGCLLVMLLMVGCATPAATIPLVPTPTPPIDSGARLTITSEHSISPAVNVDFNKQLTASLPNAIWAIVGGELPTGTMRLSNTGQFSGVATKYGETGSFTVQVVAGSQTAKADFTFRVGDSVWANPATITVTNFHPNARAEYVIKIHNDDSIVTEQKRVITEQSDVPDADGYITVPIPINQYLHDSSVTNVLATTSSNITDRLRVVSYDNVSRTLTVRGFVPLTDRIIALTYVADSLFTVQYDTVDFDVRKFVTVSDPSPILAPHETKEILVAIEFPQGYSPTMVDANGKTVPVKEFMFRILTGRAVATKGNVTVAAINTSTWTVHMR